MPEAEFRLMQVSAFPVTVSQVTLFHRSRVGVMGQRVRSLVENQPVAKAWLALTEALGMVSVKFAMFSVIEAAWAQSRVTLTDAKLKSFVKFVVLFGESVAVALMNRLVSCPRTPK